MRVIHPGILRVLRPVLNFYVLRDDQGLYVIDGGFIGGVRLLRNTLRQHGWNDLPIRGILVTHGHLDHILNVAYLAKTTGAWVAATRLDADHYAGRHRYEGNSRVTGWLEATGRVALGYQRFQPDRWLDDGDQIEIVSGLRAVHLPGHTAGHMGFWLEQQRLLFTADLFVSYQAGGRLPLDIFNDNSAENVRSIGKALALKPEGVIPNHGTDAPPEVHLQRLEALYQRVKCSGHQI